MAGILGSAFRPSNVRDQRVSTPKLQQTCFEYDNATTETTWPHSNLLVKLVIPSFYSRDATQPCFNYHHCCNCHSVGLTQGVFIKWAVPSRRGASLCRDEEQQLASNHY